jgi:hypothetical protein
LPDERTFVRPHARPWARSSGAETTGVAFKRRRDVLALGWLKHSSALGF